MVDIPAPILPTATLTIRFSPNNGGLSVETALDPLASIHLCAMVQQRMVEKMAEARTGGVQRANGSLLRALPPVNGSPS